MADDFNFIDNVSVLESGAVDEERLRYLNYLPSSIDPKDFAPVQVDGLNSTTSFSLPSGSGVTLSLLLTNAEKNTSLFYVDYAIFVGATDTPVANILPGGSSLNLAQWSLVGPIETPYDGAVATEHYQHGSRVYISQTTGSSQSITVFRRVRKVVNRGSG